MFEKEGIGPALMVATAPSTSATGTFAQDAAQTHAEPLVDYFKCRPTAVFEVAEPAAQGAVDVLDGALKAYSAGAASLLTKGSFQLLQALLAWPGTATLEAVSEKVESFLLAGVYKA